MIEITKIECQKNKNNFNLFVDGQFYSGLLKETAIANNFFVGKKIQQSQLDDILLQSEAKQAFNKASDYLSTRLHTKHELKIKLCKRQYSKQAIELALQKLEEYGYINDASFADLFVEANSSLSKQMIINKLLEKGIDKDIIDAALCNVSLEQELQSAVKQVEKYLKNKKYEDCKDKLYAFLVRKGFKYDIINRAIKFVTKNDINWE